mgnify:CR=1 FL=1
MHPRIININIEHGTNAGNILLIRLDIKSMKSELFMADFAIRKPEMLKKTITAIPAILSKLNI